MSRSNRLQIVEKLVQQREDQAAQALAQIRAQVEQEFNRLEELKLYRKEYEGYLDNQGAQGISMQQWHRTQSFIHQLEDLAIRQQQTIQSWQAREQQVLMKWQELYQRRKNISGYIDKISTEEAIAADKKEQKIIDEMISLRFHRSSE